MALDQKKNTQPFQDTDAGDTPAGKEYAK